MGSNCTGDCKKLSDAEVEARAIEHWSMLSSQGVKSRDMRYIVMCACGELVEKTGCVFDAKSATMAACGVMVRVFSAEAAVVVEDYREV